jgi:hypothetical protein
MIIASKPKSEGAPVGESRHMWILYRWKSTSSDAFVLIWNDKLHRGGYLVEAKGKCIS